MKLSIRRDGATIEMALDETASVELYFDDREALGSIRLQAGSYGPSISVNGQEVGYIDLFPCTQDEPPQILFFHQAEDSEPLVKVVLEPIGMVVVVNSFAVPGQTEHTIRNIPLDHIYTWPGDS